MDLRVAMKKSVEVGMCISMCIAPGTRAYIHIKRCTHGHMSVYVHMDIFMDTCITMCRYLYICMCLATKYRHA